MKLRNIVEKCVESGLFLSSMVTTVTILFIVFFLFKSGIGIFKESPVEDNYALAVSKQNPVQDLSASQVTEIFNRDMTNWKEAGGKDQEISIFTLDELGDHFTEEQLGENFEFIPQCVNEYMAQHDNAIAFFDRKFYPENFTGQILHVPAISFADFFAGKEWYPTIAPVARFGVFPLIMGTLWVTFFAVLMAIPVGMVTAVYLAEIAGKRTRNILKPIIELLAGIPSVVYGFFGLVVLVPFIQRVFDLPVGETALTGSIILAIMALPTIITISEDAIRTTPVALKEASLALGASHWQSITKVVIPYARSGIMTSFILGVGRAIGETMAVLMVTGNAAIVPHSLLEPVRTIPATIAAELGEAPFGGVHFKALFMLGIILFLFTLLFNSLVEMVKSKQSEK